MDETLTQKIRDDFDRISLHEPPKWNHNNHYHKFLLKQLPPNCENILDLGCGTGEFSRLLANQAQNVMAIDLSPNTIKVAKQLSKQYANITFQVANMLTWEFPREHFDAIVSIATLHHLPVEKLLPDLQTALVPGGKIVILDLLKHESIQDSLSDVVAVPLNWVLRALRNHHTKLSPEAVEAMKEHLCTDEYLNFSQVKQIYTNSLQGATVEKHLFWRYSVVWRKPCGLGGGG